MDYCVGYRLPITNFYNDLLNISGTYIENPLGFGEMFRVKLEIWQDLGKLDVLERNRQGR